MGYRPLEKDKKHSLADILQTSARLAVVEMMRVRLKDISENDYVLITPKIPEFWIIPGKEKTKEIIRSGEQAASEKITEIKRKLFIQ